MPKEDGSVAIGVRCDVSKAQKQLDDLTEDIKDSESKLNGLQEKREAAISKANEKNLQQTKELAKMQEKLAKAREAADSKRISYSGMADRLENMELNLQNMRDSSMGLKGKAKSDASARIAAYSKKVAEQRKAVNGLYQEWNKSEKEVEKYEKEIEKATQKITDPATSPDVTKYDAQIASTTEKLAKQKTEAGAIAKQLKAANTPAAKLGRQIEEAGNFTAKFEKRVKGLMKRVFVFTVITSALRSLKSWFMEVIKSNDQAQAAMAKFKGALLTLAQPIVEVLIPAFTALVNILTVIVSRIAAVVSALFGKTASQSAQAAKELNAEKEALGGVGSAAEEAAGSLAGFDEINTIQTEDKSGGGGGGGGAASAMPDFSGADAISEKLKKIADLVMLIGAGFALWKIGSAISGPLGEIIQKLGLVLMLVGAVALYAYSFNDAWNNGVDWGNLIGMITGLGLAAFALYKLFGPLAAGIALVVGGLAVLVLAFKDAMDNGWNLQNTLLAIAGIVATGLGFFFITGSVIPLVIAGIAALLLAITVATGHGQELIDGVKEFLQGFVDFFVGIFTGDIDRAVKGIQEIFDGFLTFFSAIWYSARDAVSAFIDWLDQITGGWLSGTLSAIKQIFTRTFDDVYYLFKSVWDGAKEVLTGFIRFLGGVFSLDAYESVMGLVDIFIALWDMVKNVFKESINFILGLFESFCNLIVGAINFVLSGVNGIASIFGASLNLQVSTAHIPRLAQGAVIPPNREFMAVLGDQKSGTNIEAPEDLIRKIVREETAGMKNSRPAEVKIYLDRKLLGSVLIDEINDRTIQAGRSVLKI